MKLTPISRSASALFVVSAPMPVVAACQFLLYHVDFSLWSGLESIQCVVCVSAARVCVSECVSVCVCVSVSVSVSVCVCVCVCAVSYTHLTLPTSSTV